MSAIGYVTEIFLSNDHTRIHRSEHHNQSDALETLVALGYPRHTQNLVQVSGLEAFYSLTGADHLYAKISRIERAPKPTYDFVVTVRITGKRSGWNTTVLDTPKFVLMSNTAQGSIYTYATVRNVIRDMFGLIMQLGDEMHVTIQPLELDK